MVRQAHHSAGGGSVYGTGLQEEDSASDYLNPEPARLPVRAGQAGLPRDGMCRPMFCEALRIARVIVTV